MRRVHLRRVCACAAGKQTPFPVCPVGNALFFCLRCAPVGPPLRRGGAGRMKPVAGGVQPTSIRFAEQPSDGDFQGLRPGAYAPEGAGDGGALAGGDDADDGLDRGMFGDGNSRPSEPPAVSPEEAWRGAAIIKNCLRPRAACPVGASTPSGFLFTVWLLLQPREQPEHVLTAGCGEASPPPANLWARRADGRGELSLRPV